MTSKIVDPKVDILGKKVDRDSRGLVIFDVYDSGKVIKQFKF